MTGLAAIVSKKNDMNVLPYIVELLENQKFLGFDGVGISFIESNKVHSIKYAESFDAAREKILKDIEHNTTNLVIGGIRFATHGRPSFENTPPHADCKRAFFTIMDGTLGNYEMLSKKFREEGHVLLSKTDVELISHAIETSYNSLKNFKEALIEASKNLEGYFTALILSKDEKAIGIILNGPKLYFGKNDDIFAVTTEYEAMKNLASEYTRLPNEGIAILSSDGVRVYTFEGKELELKMQKMPSKFGYNIPGGYNYFMEREIYEIPDALRRSLNVHQKYYLNLAAQLLVQASELFIVGSGTSYHAGLLGSYYFQKLAKVPVEVVYATEFIFYKIDQVRPGTVIMAISQSGKSTDVLRAVRESKIRGGTVLGILNNIGSPLMYASNIYLPIGAGPERAVPATKTFISQLLTLLKLALEASVINDTLSENEIEKILEEIYRLPSIIENVLPAIDEKAKKVAKYLASKNDVFVSSRGINYPLALEGALKLKETAYMHAEGLEAGELRHGPKALISDKFPVIMIIPREKSAREDAYSLLYEVKDMNAKVITITDELDKKADKISDFVIKLPYVSDLLTPLLYVIPLQLIALRTAIERKCPIDSPRGLAKYVILKRG